MSGMSAWDHAKILQNSYKSDKKELISSLEREFCKLTYSGLSGPNRGYSCRGSTILESSCLAKRALRCLFYLVGM